MGKIKSAMIKRAAHQMMKEENTFTTEFNTNKRLLGDTMPSKKNRNKIAGYIARLKRVEKRKKIIAVAKDD